MTATLTPDGRKIVTEYWMKPIPQRCFDWSASRDGDCGCEECRPPVGYGTTEAEAVTDLLERLEDA